MKTDMQETSLDAYFINVLPNISKKQRAVLKVFTDNLPMNFTNLELARELDWEINSVTGRVHELRGKNKRFVMDEPILIFSEKRFCRVREEQKPVKGIKRIKVNAWQLNTYWSPGGYKIG